MEIAYNIIFEVLDNEKTDFKSIIFTAMLLTIPFTLITKEWK